MQRNDLKKEIVEMLECYARAVQRYHDGDYNSIPDYSEAILAKVEKYMIPKTGGKHQSSYDLAMGSKPEWDNE